MAEFATAATEALSPLGGIAISSMAAKNQAAARERAIRERMLQEQSSANQRSINRMDQTNRLLAKQTAIAAAGGARVSAGPSSFTAIQRDTFNEFSKDSNADKLNLIFQERADEAGIESAKEAGKWGVINSIVGGVTGIAKDIADLYIPTASGVAAKATNSATNAGSALENGSPNIPRGNF